MGDNWDNSEKFFISRITGRILSKLETKQKGFKFVKMKGHAPVYNGEIRAIFNEHACLMIVKVKVDMISGIT